MKKLFKTPATQTSSSISAFAKVQLQKSALKKVKGGNSDSDSDGDIIIEDLINS